MSIRGIPVSILSASLLLACAWSSARAESPRAFSKEARGEPPSASAEGNDGPAASAEAPQHPRMGAVQQALKHLYTIPRPPTAASRRADRTTGRPATGPAASPLRLGTTGSSAGAGSDRLGLQHYDAIHDSISSVPIGGVIEPHRLGLQHHDAIHNSVSSVPIGAETREEAAAAAGPITNVIVAPGGVYPSRARLPSSERSWTNYRYYDGEPGRHGYGINEYPYAGRDGYAGDVYRFGFNKGYDVGRFDQVATDRQEAVLDHASTHLARGLTLFNEGRYREAADTFKLAAETNQGDPAARVYAAHALFATGRYRDAVRYLRRAFELQPKLAFLNYDLRDDYGRRADFDEHLEALEKASTRFPRNADRLTTLGYVLAYSNQRAAAFEPLTKANKIDPRDRLILRLIESCQPPDVVLDQIKATGKP